jgi:hypothetical protein
MERSFRQKINKEIVKLNCTLDKLDPIHIYKTVHSRAAEYALFFSSAHGTFHRINHMIGHKISLNQFLKSEISTIFSTHNVLQVEISTKHWKLYKYMKIKQLIFEQPMDQNRKLSFSK